MNTLQKSLILGLATLSTINISAGPKRAASFYGELPESGQSSKKVQTTTRKKEEDRLHEEYNFLVNQRAALATLREQEKYVNTPAVLAFEKQINEALLLHEMKALTLRHETHPAQDLKNKDWNNDPYWD